MSDDTHTPGPWFLWPKSYCNQPWTIGSREHGPRHTLAKVTRIPNYADETLSNARLISAAPELLGDVIEAERMFRWYGDLHAAKPDPEKAKRNYEMADRLAATIAKARGYAS